MNLRVPPCEPGSKGRPDTVRVPLTHVKVFGWYDNEMGSYTYRLGELTIRAARSM
jgi:glyceraldehyde 3-phosphate dehydrogenase